MSRDSGQGINWELKTQNCTYPELGSVWCKGAGDEAGATSVVEDADGVAFGGGPFDTEPVAVGAQLAGDLGGGALHPWHGVVGRGSFAAEG